MPNPGTAVVVGFQLVAGQMAGRDQARSIEDQYRIDLAGAESNLDLANQSAEFGYHYAERIMEVAGARRDLARNVAEFTKVQGAYAQSRGETLHDVYDAQANTERAISQRAAIAEDTATKRLASTGVMLTGAGGMVSEDTSRIIAEVEADGKYNSLMRIWEGEEAAAGLEYQGDIAAHEGEVAKLMADYDAAVQLMEAEIRYEEAGIVAESAIFNAEMEVANAQAALDGVRGAGPAADRAASAARRAGLVSGATGAVGTIASSYSGAG